VAKKMKMTHPYWIARGVAVLSGAIVVVLTLWDPVWIVRGSVRPVWLQCAGALGLVALLVTPDKVLASSHIRYRCVQFIALLFMAAVVNKTNWLGLLPPALALDACRSRFKMKERIREVAREATTRILEPSSDSADAV